MAQCSRPAQDQGPGGPLALVVTGPPGVGKTTTGRQLARVLGAALLDLDTMTNPLVDVIVRLSGATGEYGDPALAATVRGPRYEALLSAAVDCLSAGTPVVLIAPFTAERSDAEAWRALAERLRAASGNPHLVWLQADRELIAERMRRRGAARDAGQLAHLDQGGALPDMAAPEVPHIAVDARLDPEAQAAAVAGAIASSPVG